CNDFGAIPSNYTELHNSHAELFAFGTTILHHFVQQKHAELCSVENDWRTRTPYLKPKSLTSVCRVLSLLGNDGKPKSSSAK
ncbi:MAG: hypothetical protein NXI08_17005, partial [bacterium]|nr:hypothetical protein [bacterium]